MDFNQFNELINGKKEERKMNNNVQINEEFLRKLVDRKIDEFKNSYNEIDKMIYQEYKKVTARGQFLIGFLETLNTQDRIEFITSIVKGYVNELYEKGELEYTFTDRFNLETMFNIVKDYGKAGFLEASLYSLLK